MLKRSPIFLKAASLALMLAVLAAAVLTTPARAAEALKFNLRTADGGEISSEMLRGDVVVLAFGASWLPLSRKQVQGLQELADEFGARDVRVYWVSTDSESPKSKNYATDAQLREFAKKYGLKIAVLRDPDGALFKRMGVDQLPAIILLDRQGQIHGEPIGGLDPEGKLVNQLSPKLNELLKQQ